MDKHTKVYYQTHRNLNIQNFGELDCISRADAIKVASGYCHPSNVAKELAKLPPVAPQEPKIVPIAEIKYDEDKLKELVDKAVLTVIPQEPSRDMEEIKEVINCDADAETKCKMISNILTAKPHYFGEPFINKPCVSSGVCEHDKQKVLDKIRAEIKALSPEPTAYDVVDGNPVKDAVWETLIEVDKIIDKYKAESEPQESEG